MIRLNAGPYHSVQNSALNYIPHNSSHSVNESYVVRFCGGRYSSSPPVLEIVFQKHHPGYINGYRNPSNLGVGTTLIRFADQQPTTQTTSLEMEDTEKKAPASGDLEIASNSVSETAAIYVDDVAERSYSKSYDFFEHRYKASVN
jgi:hypothetical protein